MNNAHDNCCAPHHDHSHNHSHSHQISNKSKLAVVIFFNILITITEYVGGMISGSLSLVSDAGHNLSDVLSLMLGYAGEKVSDKKPDNKYSFGFKRFEVLVALINALSLVAIGIYLVHEAILRFIKPEQVDIKIMLPVAIIGLLGNLFSMLLLIKNRETNLNMKAAFLHLLFDTISSITVIIGAIIIHFTNILIIDTIISLIIVFMIFWSSLEIISESIRIFLQGTPSHIKTELVYKSILETTGVKSIHGLHIWSINSNEVFLSCHICLSESLNMIPGDSVIKAVNAMLEKQYNIGHTTLQIENSKLCVADDKYCCR